MNHAMIAIYDRPTRHGLKHCSVAWMTFGVATFHVAVDRTEWRRWVCDGMTMIEDKSKYYSSRAIIFYSR